MGGSSGWRAAIEYDKQEALIRAKKPKDRTKVEQRFIDSIDEMEQAEINGRHWTFYWIFRPLVIYLMCTPFMMFGYVVYTLLTK